MIKIRQYDDKYWKKTLSMRLRDAKKYREDLVEDDWQEAEATIGFANGLMHQEGDYSSLSYDDLAAFLKNDDRAGAVSVNYAFKNLRFLHAQMSANPPSVAINPTSSDPADKRRADAADRLCKHAIRAYQLQELVDIATNKALIYGTVWMKTEWDRNLGDFQSFNESTGGCIMQGDINIYSPSVWDVWAEPRAKTMNKVVWMFERLEISQDEALAKFPKSAKLIHQMMDSRINDPRMSSRENVSLEEKYFVYYKYYEKGTPYNAMQGRECCMLEDGEMLSEMGPSSFRFATAPEGDELEALIEAQERGIEIDQAHEIARLPFHLLTDIDVADQVYGKSFLYYEIPIQDAMNRIDTVTYDNCKVHGKVTLAVPDTAELDKDTLNNDTLNIIRYTQGSAPSFLRTPTLFPEMTTLRDRLKSGGDDMAGVNEAMSGNQSRETSGQAMQFSVSQGNMIRRRLFNKYTLWVEAIYIAYLDLVRKWWRKSRVIKVFGAEKASEVHDIKGADVMGGFDFKIEYGTNLSLDPVARREELMNFAPMMKEGGVTPKEILKMARFNDIGGGLDMAEMADSRQSEIFQQMIAGRGKVYIQPREMSDHENMIAFGYKYIMTNEFRGLPEVIKQLIEKHIKAREGIIAGDLSGAAGAGGPQVPAQPEQPSAPIAAPVTAAGPEMSAGPSLPAIP